DQASYGRINTMLLGASAKLLSQEPDPKWAFWSLERATAIRSKVLARKWRPQSEEEVKQAVQSGWEAKKGLDQGIRTLEHTRTGLKIAEGAGTVASFAL